MGFVYVCVVVCLLCFGENTNLQRIIKSRISDFSSSYVQPPDIPHTHLTFTFHILTYIINDIHITNKYLMPNNHK